MQALKPIQEQVVVVFGASSGIGRETALMFAQQGASVVVAARNNEALEMLVKEITGKGGKAVSCCADTTLFEDIVETAEKAVTAFGRIDSWVHVAGIPLYAPFIKTTPEEFTRIIEVNLLGQAYGAMVAIRYLREAGGGALIQIGSVESEIGFPYQSAYAASKHGIKGFADVLRLELEHDRIPVSVTTILPAGINTPFFNHARTKLGVKPKPSGPIYQPELVARAILYAAEHPIPEIVVGGGGKLFIWGKRMFPGLVNKLLLRTSFSDQLTKEYKTTLEEDNFFGPSEHDTRIHGDFDTRAHRQCAVTWMEMHPRLRGIIKTTMLGSLAYFLYRRLGRSRLRKHILS